MIDITALLHAVRLDGQGRAADRTIAATARRYNQLLIQFEALQKAIGFDKPFPFLKLPRELRDQIYQYALQAETNVCIHSDEYKATKYQKIQNPFVPPTPGLVGINHEIWQEAIEVLYSKNTFSFLDVPPALEFFYQAGRDNLQHLRKFCINMRGPWSNGSGSEQDEETINSSQGEMDGWIEVLNSEILTHVTYLKVISLPHFLGSDEVPHMPERFHTAILGFFKKQIDKKSPTLVLIGFKEETRARYPDEWHVTVDGPPWK